MSAILSATPGATRPTVERTSPTAVVWCFSAKSRNSSPPPNTANIRFAPSFT
jgi:hypothetical protein